MCLVPVSTCYVDAMSEQSVWEAQARMNGGTSIASAIQKAGQLLKTVDRTAQPLAAGDDGADGAEGHQGPAAEAEEAGPSHVHDAVEEVADEPAATVSNITRVRQCAVTT